MRLVINDFPGIAPGRRQAEPGAVTYAAVAENADLTGKSLRPIKNDSFISSGHTSEIVKFRGNYMSGLEDPIVWKKGDLDVLIYKDSGAWYKQVGTEVATLGIPLPSAAVLEDISLKAPSGLSSVGVATASVGESNLPDVTMAYYASWVIVVNGKEYEGDLSSPMEVAAPEAVGATKNTIIRPSSPPSGVARWRLYRADNGDTPKLLETLEAVGAAGASYTDRTSTYHRGVNASDYIAKGNDQYTFNYFVVWERNTGGWLEDSGPSVTTQISQRNVGVRVHRPGPVPAGVENWKIYRISTDYRPTTEFQLVAIVPAETPTYEDYLYNDALGSAPGTYFESSSLGEFISYQPPQTVFSGMSGPFFGTFFAWSGSKLYLSDPGKPDVWPEAWEQDAHGDIIAIEQNGSEVMVFTSNGAQRGIGGTPESFYLAPGIIGESCLNRKCAVATQDGIWYLSKNGLNRVFRDEVRLWTTEILGRDYFLGIDVDSAKMWYYNEFLLISYYNNTLIYDISNNKYITLDRYISSAWWDREAGYLAILDNDTIKGWRSGPGTQSVNYKTGEITLSAPDIKSYPAVRFHGTGKMTATLFIDGEAISTREIDMDGMRRNREMKTKADTLGRELSIQVQGSSGEVKEIEIEVYEKATL